MKKLFILLFICLCGCIQAQIAAFPGAEGFGAVATGGRGGNVYVVTNLNDAGAGSFRDAVSQPNRIVVFAVGGVIHINSAITVQSNITIAGQTAPGEGIAIYGNTVAFRSNVICRYLRLHGSINMPSSNYTLSAGGVDKGMFDHVSVLWGRWDNMKLDNNSTNITFQYCLIGEAILPQKLGALFELPSNVSVHHTLWLNNKSRNPKAKAYIEYVNNVVYNWGSDAFVLGHSSANCYQDIIGNYFLAGPESSATGIITQGGSNDHVYQTGNYLSPNKNGTLAGRDVTNSDVRSATIQSSRYFTGTRAPAFPITVDPAATAFQKVIAKAGASKRRDFCDIRLINQVKSYGTQGKLITREGDVGGQPSMLGGIPANDSNGTGIPDWWAEAMGFGSAATSAWSKTLRDGYMELEHYINAIATAGVPEAEITGIIPASGTVSDDPFTDGCTTGSQTIHIRGTAAAGANVEVSRVDIGVLGSVTTDASGDWIYDYTGTSLPERYYAFTARVKRADNSLSYSSAAYAVRVKTTPSAPPVISRMTVDPSKTFSGTTDPYATVNVFIQGNSTSIATGVADGYGNWNATTTGTFASQVYTFVAEATDLAGITTSPSNPPFRVDMSIPTPVFTRITPVTGEADYPQITGSRNLTFYGTAEPNAGVKVYYLLNDSPTSLTVGNVTADASGNWTLDYSATTLAEGLYTLMATVDFGSTPSPMSAPFIVDVDLTRPVVSSIRRHDPETESTSASTLVYRVTFAEPVVGVAQNNFSVARSGSGMAGNITGFAKIDDSTYDVTVTDAAGDGSIRVNLSANLSSIQDLAGNPCNASYTSGQAYTMRYAGSGVWITEENGEWNDPEVWDDNAIANGSGATADFSTVDIEGQTVVTLDSPVSLGRMIFGDADEESAGSWRVTGNGAISLANPTGVAPEIKVNYDNDDTGLDYNKANKGRNYPAIIESTLNSNSGLSKTGWGTLELRNIGTFSGQVTVSQGYLKIGPGAELHLSTELACPVAGSGLLIAGGTFSTTANVSLNFSSYSLIEVSGGRADFNRIVPGNNRNGTIRVSGGDMTANELNLQRSSDASIDWSTGVFISGGTATIGVLGLGTNNSWATATLSGGKLTVTDAFYIGYQATGGRGGGVRVTGGELVATGSTGIVLSRKHSNGNANNVASLAITGGTVTAKRIALGYNSEVNAGSATLSLSGSNSSLYLGSGGLVRPGASSGFSATVTLSGGTLGADEDWTTTVPLPLGGNITIKAADASNAAHNITLGGVISGSYGFTKTGAGMLTLTATNSYTGTTTVSEGILRIGDGGTTGRINNAINVQANAILAGSATANGSVSVAGDGIVHPGATASVPTTLTINNLTLHSGILRFNLYPNDACDRIHLTGTLTADGTNRIDVTTLIPGTYNLGSRITALSAATVSLNGQTVDEDAATLSVSGTDLWLTIADPVLSINLPAVHPLKAWKQNGMLHVSGLIAGKLWRVYNISGMLLYQGIAGSDTENIDGFPAGMYMVMQEGHCIKTGY